MSSDKKRILLVAPRMSGYSYWSLRGQLKMEGKKRQGPSLPLLLIAAMLPDDRYELRLIDMELTELGDSDLAWADAVFLSGMTADVLSMNEALSRAKAVGRTTVLGGPHAIAFYPDIANVDCFVLGEAESVWPWFLADLDAGTLKKAYAAPISEAERDALRSHFGTDAFYAPEGSPLPDLDCAPVPRFDLLEMGAYLQMHIQTMRGCPAQCEFCDVWRRFGRKVRVRSVEKVLAELDELYRLGWRGEIFFANDNLIGDRGYAKKLLAAIARWQVEHGRPFLFSGEGSLNLAEDKELLDLLRAANVTFLFIGLETPHADSLREVHKLTNLKGDMAKRVAAIQAHGIHVAAGFIVGFDSDPPDVVERIFAAVQEMAIPYAMVSILTSLPNTVLTERLRQEGRLNDRISLTSNDTTFMPNFRTARAPGAVAASYQALLDALYPNDMKSYFERCAVFLQRRGRKQKKLKALLAEIAPGAARLAPEETRGIWETLLRCPLYGRRMLALGRMLTLPYALNAVRFLLHVWRTRPSRMVSAFTMVFQAHHFWWMTRTYLEAAEVWGHMKERLVALHRSLGQAYPASTHLLGVWQPSHDYLETADRTAAEGPMQGAHPESLPQVRKEEMKHSLLLDMERQYNQCSESAQAMLADALSLFRRDVQDI